MVGVCACVCGNQDEASIYLSFSHLLLNIISPPPKEDIMFHYIDFIFYFVGLIICFTHSSCVYVFFEFRYFNLSWYRMSIERSGARVKSLVLNLDSVTRELVVLGHLLYLSVCSFWLILWVEILICHNINMA